MKRPATERPPTVRRLGRGLSLLALALLAVAGVVAGVGGAATTPAAGNPPVNSSLPAVTGTAQQGQTLTATTGIWTGDTPISYSFQWQRCDSSGGTCSDLATATAQTYLATSSDVGATLRVVITASNAAGSATAASGPTGVVAPAGSKPAPPSQPTPSGTARVGQTLSINPGTWSGTAPITFSYQWQRCDSGGSCPNISGATKSSYVVATSDVGNRLRVKVTGTNSIGSTSVDSNLTAVVVAAVALPSNTSRPTISGSSTSVGSTLTGSVGRWSGPGPITFSLSWQRCDGGGNNCHTISGATASTYTLASADAGATIRFVVRASNPGGSTTVTSTQTAKVTTLPAGAIQLPGGGVSIPVTSVSLPDRLVISGVSYSPNPVRSRATFQGRFRVTDTRGYIVRGALVYALGLPYSWVTRSAEVQTGTDGYAYVDIHPSAKMPLAKGKAMVVFVRARKPGESVLTGVSTRRLTQVRLGRP